MYNFHVLDPSNELALVSLFCFFYNLILDNTEKTEKINLFKLLGFDIQSEAISKSYFNINVGVHKQKVIKD